MQDEQEVIQPQSDKSLPDVTTVPPGQSGIEQTEKQGGAKAEPKPKENKEVNEPGKPVKLPSDKLDVRL